MTLGGEPCGDPQREEAEENSDGEGKEGLRGRAGLVKTSRDLFQALPGRAQAVAGVAAPAQRANDAGERVPELQFSSCLLCAYSSAAGLAADSLSESQSRLCLSGDTSVPQAGQHLQEPTQIQALPHSSFPVLLSVFSHIK